MYNRWRSSYHRRSPMIALLLVLLWIRQSAATLCVYIKCEFIALPPTRHHHYRSIDRCSVAVAAIAAKDHWSIYTDRTDDHTFVVRLLWNWSFVAIFATITQSFHSILMNMLMITFRPLLYYLFVLNHRFLSRCLWTSAKEKVEYVQSLSRPPRNRADNEMISHRWLVYWSFIFHCINVYICMVMYCENHQLYTAIRTCLCFPT